MRTLLGPTLASLLGLGLLSLPASAWAQGVQPADVKLDEEGGEGAASGGEGSAGGAEAAQQQSADGAAQGSAGAGATATQDPSMVPDKHSPVEEPGKTYQFVGARYRGIYIPQFIVDWFAVGGTGIYENSVGAEYARRRDDFEMNFGISYASYGMDERTMRGKNESIEDWERIQSKLSMLYLTGDFLFSAPVSHQVAINYGLGAGLGIVFGNLYRTQATPPGGDVNAPPQTWVKCSGPGVGPYCDATPKHYNGYVEPSWAGGGSVPIVFPWLALQTGIRYKPAKEFVARLDLGFGTSGFFWGLGLDYGL